MQNSQMTQQHRPVLIVFSGLPGTGKTTLAKALATRLGAVYLRIDTIEAAMQAAGMTDIGAAGYVVANALADANLRLGQAVVADCVNPVRDSRHGWRDVAARAGAVLADILLICSDLAEHKRRVEGRSADIPGFVLPSWDDVTQRAFDARDDDHLRLDTATMLPAELAARCMAYVSERLEPPARLSDNPISASS